MHAAGALATTYIYKTAKNALFSVRFGSYTPLCAYIKQALTILIHRKNN